MRIPASSRTKAHLFFRSVRSAPFRASAAIVPIALTALFAGASCDESDPTAAATQDAGKARADVRVADAVGGGSDATTDASTPDAAPDAIIEDVQDIPYDGPVDDAGPGDLTCYQFAQPSTAKDPLGYNVTAKTSSGAALGGVTSEIYDATPVTLLASGTGNGSGSLALTFAIGSISPFAFDLYAKHSKSGFQSTYTFVPPPLRGNSVDESPLLFQSTELQSSYAAGSSTWDSSKGFVVVNVRDCAGRAFAGAEVIFNPRPARIVYPKTDVGTVVVEPAGSTRALGVAWGYNVTPGSVSVTVRYLGSTLVTFPVTSFAGGRTVAATHF